MDKIWIPGWREGAGLGQKVIAALGRLCLWQGKDYMTSLKKKGVTEGPIRWEWGGEEGGLLGVMEE